MPNTEKSVEVLNDLIRINKDRIKGFEKANEHLNENDQDLRKIFSKLATESTDNIQELEQVIETEGGKIEEENTTTGAIHRAWLDIKAAFSGNDRHSILEECERGEDAIKKAYKAALEPQSALSAYCIAIVDEQHKAISAGHDQIKAIRDSN